MGYKYIKNEEVFLITDELYTNRFFIYLHYRIYGVAVETKGYISLNKLDFLPPTLFELKNLKYLNILYNNFNSGSEKDNTTFLPDCRIDIDVVCYKPKHKY